MTAGGGRATGGRYHQPRGRTAFIMPNPGARNPNPTVGADECLLCGKPGHRAVDCPTKGYNNQAPKKRAFGSYASDFALMAYGKLTEAVTESDPEIDPCHAAVAFSMDMCRGYGILDGGATKSVGSVNEVQELADRALTNSLEVSIEDSRTGFSFAGGGGENASVSVKVPVGELDNQAVGIHTLAGENTPILLGIDTLIKFGLVIDYAYDRVYSYKLGRMIQTVKLPSGHLAVPMAADLE